jgi:hypothetical protein
MCLELNLVDKPAGAKLTLPTTPAGLRAIAPPSDTQKSFTTACCVVWEFTSVFVKQKNENAGF